MPVDGRAPVHATGTYTVAGHGWPRLATDVACETTQPFAGAVLSRNFGHCEQAFSKQTFRNDERHPFVETGGTFKDPWIYAQNARRPDLTL